MDMYEYRHRTQKSWDKMRERFREEWADGFDTVQKHQFRATRRNGVHDGRQVTDYFAAHGNRILDERYPEYKGDVV